MNQTKWLDENIEDMTNKTAIITGATGGIGNSIARNLLRKNANIIIAARNLKKAEAMKVSLLEEFPSATVKIYHLDVSSLESIESFVKTLEKNQEQCNFLIQNAGVYNTEKFKTSEGFELRFATNFLGPIFLTIKMLPILNKNTDSKIIFQSSISSKFYKFDWTDIESTTVSSSTKIYGRTKYLLNLTAIKLQQICNNDYKNVKISLVHPGICGTNIVQFNSNKKGLRSLFPKLAIPIMKVVCHSPETASLTTMFALSKNIESGQWVVPSGLAEIWGMPKVKEIDKNVFNQKEIDKAYTKALELIQSKGYLINEENYK